ncbi:hypothetical protein FB451DRAFT_1344896 [Mycena latifolia]|nr:hypothetical protein FB451DRAFT_1344896 [Mycena latifolia]
MPWYYSPRPSLIAGICDAHFALAAPIAVCWSASLLFHCLDNSGWTALDRYRIHESSEGVATIRNILLQHALQTALGLLSLRPAENPVGPHAEMVSAFARRLALTGALREPAVCPAAYFIYWIVMDTWQYFIHSFMHRNNSVYRRVHSWHHRNYAALLFCLAIAKAVDDHCGYRFPLDPLQMLSQNSVDLYDIRRQEIGMNYNSSATFFVHWDTHDAAGA